MASAAFLIGTREPRVTNHIGYEDSGKAPLISFFPHQI
jgi:hypothetical protein